MQCIRRVTNIVDINETIQKMILRVNYLTITIERDWVNEKTRSTLCFLQETHFKYIGTYRIKVKVWRKTYHIYTNQKKVIIVILIS